MSLTTQQSDAFDAAYAQIQSQAKSFHKFVPLILPSALDMDGEPAHRRLFSEYLARLQPASAVLLFTCLLIVP